MMSWSSSCVDFPWAWILLCTLLCILQCYHACVCMSVCVQVTVYCVWEMRSSWWGWPEWSKGPLLCALSLQWLESFFTSKDGGRGLHWDQSLCLMQPASPGMFMVLLGHAGEGLVGPVHLTGWQADAHIIHIGDRATHSISHAFYT